MRSSRSGPVRPTLTSGRFVFVRLVVVKIKLPGHKLADITLDVTRKAVDVRTPRLYVAGGVRVAWYRSIGQLTVLRVRLPICSKLLLPLSRDVDHKNGTAEWESDTCTLRVICPILQDDDD